MKRQIDSPLLEDAVCRKRDLSSFPPMDLVQRRACETEAGGGNSIELLEDHSLNLQRNGKEDRLA